LLVGVGKHIRVNAEPFDTGVLRAERCDVEGFAEKRGK
jgi:hypothetical protein